MTAFYSHETAILDEGCTIGDGSKIWHFSHVMGGAILGNNCNIGQNCLICDEVKLGNNVKVQNNVSLYTGVECQDDVFVGPSAVFTNILNPRSAVIRRGQYTSTLVKKGATLGANCTIVCGTELGSYSFIGAGTVVTKNVPAYALIVGNPGRQIGWMSEFGQRLNFDVSGYATCPESNEQYQLLNGQVSKL